MTHWQLFYRDLFDMDAPVSVDKEGDGLEAGLRALWSASLLEKIRGLSDFWLRVDGDHTRDISIAWDRGRGPGPDRLKAWASADDTLHDLLATCQVRLMEKGVPPPTIHESVFDLAGEADDAETFRGALEALADDGGNGAAFDRSGDRR